MNGAKPFYLSTGILGCSTGAAGILGALIAALSALKGLEIGPESQALIVTLFVSFGGAIAGLIGRIKAESRIGRAPGYANGGTIKPVPYVFGESIPDTLAPLAGRISSEILHTSGPGLADVLDKLAEAIAALNAHSNRPSGEASPTPAAGSEEQLGADQRGSARIGVLGVLLFTVGLFIFGCGTSGQIAASYNAQGFAINAAWVAEQRQAVSGWREHLVTNPEGLKKHAGNVAAWDLFLDQAEAALKPTNAQ